MLNDLRAIEGRTRQKASPRAWFAGAAVIALAILLHSPGAAATVFTVNWAAEDKGDYNKGDGYCDTEPVTWRIRFNRCTLRAAIEEANVDAGADEIRFNIPGTGVQTIKPTSCLPAIAYEAKIDGSTQPGYAVGKPVIMLDGSGISADADCTRGIEIDSNYSSIKSLITSKFPGNGVYIMGNNNRVSGCFIGTDATGMQAQGNSSGIHIYGDDADNNIIGGWEAAERNVISGNLSDGIYVSGGSEKNEIYGNYIGVDTAGTNALGNGAAGISLKNGFENKIGMIDRNTGAVAGNVISGNIGAGINLYNRPAISESRTWIVGNKIGTDAAGARGVGNGGSGISISYSSKDVIGLRVVDQERVIQAGNVIAFNGKTGNAHGVHIEATSDVVAMDNSISANSIFSNYGRGIALGYGDVVANDPSDDADSGPNGLQNFPEISSAKIEGEILRIAGSLSSKANDDFVIELFANEECDPSGHGEGQFPLGEASVTTNSSGSAEFSADFAMPKGARYVTATATAKCGMGSSERCSTSEFSKCAEIAGLPPPACVAGDTRPECAAAKTDQKTDQSPICGNGTKDGDESCDDGNTADGDGCSSKCAIEGTGPTPQNTDIETTGETPQVTPPAGSGTSGSGSGDSGGACTLAPRQAASATWPALAPLAAALILTCVTRRRALS